MIFKLLTLNTGSEFICFLVALICLPGSNYKFWLLFIPYLFIIFITEVAGAYLKSLHHANQWPYNILLVCQILFTSFAFMQLLEKYIRPDKVIILGIVGLFLLYIYDLNTTGFFRFANVTYNVMCVLFLIYSLYYFYLLMKDDNYIVLKYSFEFWLVTGALFFYFGSTAVNIFRGKLSDVTIGDYSLTHYIYYVLNVILYGCWSYSFICKKWLTKTSET